jgi:hypothetical protein
MISFALALGICSLFLPQGSFAADDVNVKMDGASFQEIVDKLFGTTENPGLLEGDKHFSLHAKDVTLTEAQADLFFNPSEANIADFADLVAAAEALKANLKIEGEFLDGDGFKLNLSGKQIKLEGLVLTQAEFDALIAELQEIDGLKQAKIQATVDGKVLIAKLENQPGRVKIEDKSARGKPETNTDRRGPNSGSGDNRLEASNRGNGRGPGDRPEKIEKIERIERGSKGDRPDRLEKIERGGPDRR